MILAPLYFLGFVLALIAILFHIKQKENWAFSFLLLSVACFSFLSISQYDFLLPWDERFHALVAKNAMSDPFHLKLYAKPILDIDYGAWYKAHTWLHKQPLFTWQMALCMHIFGDSVLGMRMASFFMMLLLFCSVYFGSKLIQAKAAFGLAAIVGFLPVLYYLINGKQGMDHNDICFVAWVAFSFWGFIKMMQSKKRRAGMLMLIIGVACAVLTKWLAGLLVFAAWGLHLLHQKNWKPKEWGYLFLALLGVAVLVAPWQLYAFSKFPELAHYEWTYNSRHLYEVIEGHDGTWYYHLTVWTEKLLPVALMLFISTLILLIFQRKNTLLFALVGSAFIALLFFSLAQTKLTAYTFLAISPALFSVAAAFSEAINSSKFIKSFYFLLPIIALTYFTITFEPKIKNDYFDALKKEMVFYTTMKTKLPENAVIFNVPSMQHPEAMFYTDCIVYDYLPTQDLLLQAIKKGYNPVFVNTDTTKTLDASIVGSYPVFNFK